MRIVVERSQFLKSLNHVQSVVERRNTIPILSNILLQAKGGKIRLTATDLDVEVVESLGGDIAREGATTVPAHMLHDIVRKLPDGTQVEIVQGPDDKRLSLHSGRSRFTLQSLPAEDFPDMTAGDLSHRFSMGASDLKGLIEKTKFAISTEETRYYLNGIYLHEVASPGGERLRAVATDGHRLAQAEIPRPGGAAGMPGVIVPRKTVLELSKLIEDLAGEVEIALSSAKIQFRFDSLVLTSKLIDGTFPDYGRVIPQNNDKELIVDKKDFEAAVDRVSTISSERGRAVKLALSSGKLVLSVTNPDSGSATEELEVEYASDALDIGFNSRYLLDIAAQIEGEVAVLRLADPGSPTLVQDKDNKGALYVLMPMRV
jgi:DNA polymerase III subunit beta